MFWYDYLIIVVPVLFVIGMGLYTRRYLKDVTAFLSAGRVCGRYVISMGGVATAISIISLVAYVEVSSKTGFALSFWSSLTTPIAVLFSLYGYCTYRFRETKAQSIGEFLEIRYSRKFRVFAAVLRSLTEMLTNMIMPSLAARFYMYFLGLPEKFMFCGIEFSTFSFIMVVVLTIAVSIICMGGSLSIVVTDTIQGFICYPLMVLFVIFILCKFSWSREVLPVLSNRVAGESFLSPYDMKNLRDFNYFFLLIGILDLFMHRMSWLGGGDGAAKSAHEQKMANLLGTWRASIVSIFYVLVAVAILTFMTHAHFAPEAHKVRVDLTAHIAHDLVKNPQVRDKIIDDVKNMPVRRYDPSVDKPLSGKDNVDTPYLNCIHNNLKLKDEAKGNSIFQQFSTLYHQQMMSVTLRDMLPPGLLGLFCLLMILAMISTDDSCMFSATITIAQDVILPFIKKTLTVRQHIWILRIVAIGIGIFFFFGSKYMAQLDYIKLYSTMVCTMWMGGCGPLLVFGLYSRFGTTWGAWVSLVTGMVMALIGLLIQRNWADFVYPWLAQHDLVEVVGQLLATLSRPFEPIVLWRMNAVKCPVNSYEWYFITQITTLVLYIGVSYLTLKEPFNIDRMLHRGKYAIDGAKNLESIWTWKNLYNKMIGITPEYTTGDKCIAWGYFFYSMLYRFLGTFVVVVIWNLIDPWPAAWWGVYFLVVFMLVPGFMAGVTAIWFGIGGVIDLRNMFRDLETRVANPLDNGRVEGNVSLADKEAMEKIDAESKE